jgi:hypothetical protein
LRDGMNCFALVSLLYVRHGDCWTPMRWAGLNALNGEILLIP